jgi:biotin transport system substrate-specific component
VSATGHASVGTAPLGVTLGEALLPSSLRQRARSLPRDIVLVASGVVLITLGAWISFSVPTIGLGNVYIPANPYVPISLQTLGVLFTGALLGANRGAAAAGIYLALGIVGLPVFAVDPATGIHPTGIGRLGELQDGKLVLGTTGGYLIGFVVAAAAVGRLAERGWDRRFGSSIAAMVVGTLIVYALGVAWLTTALILRDVPDPFGVALVNGLYPFIPGDIAKLLVAAGLLPLGWRLVSRRASGPLGGPSAPS